MPSAGSRAFIAVVASATARVRRAEKLSGSGYPPVDAAVHEPARALATNNIGNFQQAVVAAQTACDSFGM